MQVLNRFKCCKGEPVLSQRVKNLTPYVPGEQPQDMQYLKLNTNENPYPPTPKIQDFIKELNIEKLRLYPDPLANNLREKIAQRYLVKKENVFVGNGSDEVLSFAFYAFFDSSMGKLLFPNFTYSFYPIYCNFYSIDYDKVPLNIDFSVNINGFLNGAKSCGIIFPNPNAPTGILLSIDDLNDLLERYPKDRVVIIDEAYIDFGGQSAVSLIVKYKNLLVIRTFSKSMSLAGLRLGFAMGDKKLIEPLFAVKDSFNSYPIDMLALKIGEIAIEDEDYYRSTAEKIINNRTKLSDELEKIGWEVLPSQANFIFTKKHGVTGQKVYETLKSRGILVRYFNIEGIKDFVRITIGTKEQLSILLKEVKKCFNGK
jgi:histidinol-phosphate aminotransferase